MNSSEHIVFDEEKIKKYSLVLCNSCESLYEINLSTGVISTIFFNGVAESAKPEYKTKELKSTLAQSIIDKDKRKFDKFFSEGKLRDVIKNKYSSFAEFNVNSNNNDKCMRVCLTPSCDENEDIILCYNMLLSSKNDKLRYMNNGINEMFKNSYKNIYIIDLNTGFATVCKNSEKPDTEGDSIFWDSFIDDCKDNLVCISHRKLVNDKFSLSGLTNLYERKDKSFCTDIRCKTNKKEYFWLDIEIKFALTDDGPIACFAEKDSEEIHFLHSMVDKLIYKNCDYVINLDVKNNSYVMIHNDDKETLVPQLNGSSFSDDMIAHIDKYVVEDDKKQVAENLIPQKISKNLNDSDEFSFSFGMTNDKGNYKRKRIKYLYYDKPNKLVLLMRDDITEQYIRSAERNAKLTAALERAQKDPLTQVYNKQAAKEYINNILLETGDSLSALLFLDLDNFKTINDTFGHSRGDDTLRIVAESLVKSVRSSDIVGRLGGDEFVIFLSKIPTKGEVLRCVERIFKRFDEIYVEHIQDNNIKYFSCSIGIAFSSANGENFDSLVDKADIALYKSKRMGKNCCSIYSDNI